MLTTPGPPPWDPGPRPREQALSRRLGRLLSRTHAALHDFCVDRKLEGGGGARERSARTARPCPVVGRLVGGLLRFAWYMHLCGVGGGVVDFVSDRAYLGR